MITLIKSIQAWGTPQFESVLKHEIEALDKSLLPLQQALSVSSYVADSPHTAMIQRVSADEKIIHVKVGIAYAGIIPGCSCADDPTPLNENPEYCILEIEIERNSGNARIMLTA